MSGTTQTSVIPAKAGIHSIVRIEADTYPCGYRCMGPRLRGGNVDAEVR